MSYNNVPGDGFGAELELLDSVSNIYLFKNHCVICPNVGTATIWWCHKVASADKKKLQI